MDAAKEFATPLSHEKMQRLAYETETTLHKTGAIRNHFPIVDLPCNQPMCIADQQMLEDLIRTRLEKHKVMTFKDLRVSQRQDLTIEVAFHR